MTAPVPALIVASAGGNGSLGDCAMIHVAAERLGSRYGAPPAVLFWTGEELTETGVPAVATSPLQEHRCSPGGFWARTVPEHQEYLRSFAGLREVCVIGADCVDGIYDATMPADLTRLLNAAVSLGIEARLINFSVSAPLPPAAMALAHLSDRVKCRVRDARSQARMEAILGREVPLTADIAFLLEPEARAASTLAAIEWASAQRRAGAQVIGVNVSWLLRRDHPGLAARYADALARLAADRPCAVLLVPHDVRKEPGWSDVSACREVHDLLPEPLRARSMIWDLRFRGQEAKALIGAVDAVLTARMHLAIAALGRGVPPLCIDSAGKVHGLYDLFRLSDLVVPPDASAATMAAALGRCLDARTSLEQRIRARLPEARRLAESTFA